jgi:hypothetical protein
MVRRIALAIVMLSLAVLAGCGGAKQDEPAAAPPPSAQAPPAEPPAAQTPPAAAEPAAAPPRQEAAPAPAQPRKVEARSPATTRGAGAGTAIEPAVPAAVVPPPPAKTAAEAAPSRQPVVVRIPAGTRFEVRLLEPIDSAKNQVGDTFKASLDKDLEADGRVVAPRGSTVLGKLTSVTPPGRVEGRAAMSVTVTSITVGENTYPIQTNTLAFEAEKTVKEDAKKIGIGAGIGAVIGAIAGGGKGAAIGAAVGGGAGTATVLATKGKDVKFGVEDRFSFILSADLEIRY